MSDEDFIDRHMLGSAFIAFQLERLTELIVTQGNDMLDAAGITFPSRAVSTVLYIGEHQPTSTADIARALGQAHQVATQRVDILIRLGIVERVDDPDDGRRKLLRLTRQGKNQFQILTLRLAKAGQAFEALFDEIGCDLPAVIQRATDSLLNAPLLSRMKDS
ncbi:MAG: MarR family transcriptional regulator [Hyphomonas sp.]